MLTTSPPSTTSPIGRRAVLAAAAGLLAGCAAVPGPVSALARPAFDQGVFVMADGARLPYRNWLPAGAPTAVVLALHGFNDSRDAWEIPAVNLTAAGFALYGPDQRSFGGTAGRGLWAGTAAMVQDAATMAQLVRQRHPGAPLVLMGESMGGAVLMCLATSRLRPPDARYVLVAPAVWGRATMNVLLRSGLWLGAAMLPELALSGAPVRVTATDNRAALIRLSRDPLTLRYTRIDTLRGLVDLMDAASFAAASFTEPGLFLYGGRDELVPKGAMAAMWRHLPPGGARRAFYPHDYHLMLRDLERSVPLDDIIAWVAAPDAPLPSGADRAAASWLARQS